MRRSGVDDTKVKDEKRRRLYGQQNYNVR